MMNLLAGLFVKPAPEGCEPCVMEEGQEKYLGYVSTETRQKNVIGSIFKNKALKSIGEYQNNQINGIILRRDDNNTDTISKETQGQPEAFRISICNNDNDKQVILTNGVYQIIYDINSKTAIGKYNNQEFTLNNDVMQTLLNKVREGYNRLNKSLNTFTSGVSDYYDVLKPGQSKNLVSVTADKVKNEFQYCKEMFNQLKQNFNDLIPQLGAWRQSQEEAKVSNLKAFINQGTTINAENISSDIIIRYMNDDRNFKNRGGWLGNLCCCNSQSKRFNKLCSILETKIKKQTGRPFSFPKRIDSLSDEVQDKIKNLFKNYTTDSNQCSVYTPAKSNVNLQSTESLAESIAKALNK